MAEQSWERTADAVRAALDAGELDGLVPLLAPEVRWHGAGAGGCRSRDDVRAWVGGLPPGFRLLDLRRVADRIGLRVATPTGDEAHQLVVLDDDGRITLVLDHPDAASVQRDLVPPSDPGAVAVDALVPFVDVVDVEASIAFYALLGFAVVAEHRHEDVRTWARLRSGAAELMVAQAEEPPDPAAQRVLFALRTADLDGLRQHLRARGHHPSAIVDGSPGPRRELRVDDPDGYCLMIAEGARIR